MAKAILTIEGFVAKDPEERQAQAYRIVSVTVPVTPSKRVNGEWVNDDAGTIWYEAEFWDVHGDSIRATVSKGSFVTITGTPKLEVFMRKDGTPGAKITFNFPQLSVIVQKPKRGEVRPQQGNDEPWASTAPTSTPAATGGDVWNAPGNFTDETPW